MTDRELNRDGYARAAAQLVTKWAGKGWLDVDESARDGIESDVENVIARFVGRAHAAMRQKSDPGGPA